MKRSSRHRAFQILIVLLVMIGFATAAVRLIWEYNPTLIARLIGSSNSTKNQCTEIIDPDARLNRNQILKL